MTTGKRIGEVTHYYNKISVAVLKLEKELAVGDMVHFLGRHTDFRQEIESMQIEHEDIEEAEKGAEVAVKVKKRVRRGDSAFLLTQEG
jgi:putative protease